MESLTLTERRYRVAKWALEGFSQDQIAAMLGINQATVSRDLEKIRAGWQQESEAAAAAARATAERRYEYALQVSALGMRASDVGSMRVWLGAATKIAELHHLFEQPHVSDDTALYRTAYAAAMAGRQLEGAAS